MQGKKPFDGNLRCNVCCFETVAQIKTSCSANIDLGKNFGTIAENCCTPLWFCEAQTFLQVVVYRHFLRFVRKRKKICRLLQLQSKCTGNKTFQNSEASGKQCCWVGESTRKPSARPLQQRNPKRISRKVKYSLKDLRSFFVNCDLWQAMASRCNADVFLTPT